MSASLEPAEAAMLRPRLKTVRRGRRAPDVGSCGMCVESGATAFLPDAALMFLNLAWSVKAIAVLPECCRWMQKREQ